MKALNVIFILLLAGFLGLWFWSYAIPSSHLRALADVAQQELVEVPLFSNLTAFWHNESRAMLQAFGEWLTEWEEPMNRFNSNIGMDGENSPLQQAMVLLWALYQWLVVVVVRVEQTLVCLILSAPAALAGWRYAVLKEKIRQHDFGGELPAVLQHKKAALFILVALILLLQLLPVKIPMSLLMVVTGGWMTMIAMFLATVRETNRFQTR